MKLPRRAFGSRAAYAPGPGFARVARVAGEARRGTRERAETARADARARGQDQGTAQVVRPRPGGLGDRRRAVRGRPETFPRRPRDDGGGSRDGMLLGERDATTVSPPRDRDVMARRGRRGASQSREASFDTREKQIRNRHDARRARFFFFFSAPARKIYRRRPPLQSPDFLLLPHLHSRPQRVRSRPQPRAETAFRIAMEDDDITVKEPLEPNPPVPGRAHLCETARRARDQGKASRVRSAPQHDPRGRRGGDHDGGGGRRDVRRDHEGACGAEPRPRSTASASRNAPLRRSVRD